MICTLIIHNVALIEHVSVSFHEGMVVLSGETGAGKSIIVDAVALLLGGRADRDLIRTGCDKASVEAEFETESGNACAEILAREQIDYDGCSLTIFREISMTGRNICRINGVPVTVSVLKETAACLLNLHGQSEYQFLADEEKHLSYLDLMGDENHQLLLKNISEAYQRFITNHREYAKIVKMSETRERREDILRRELGEMQMASIQPGEEEKLSEESRLMHKASRIHEKINLICTLTGDGGDRPDALHNLQSAAKELRNLGNEDPAFDSAAEKCETLFYELEEVVKDLNTLNEKYDFDENKLNATENRLESIRRVLRKYGPEEADALRHQKEMEEEYNTLQELDSRLQKMGTEHKRLLSAYRAKAKELTESRKAIAAGFEQKMMSELKDLGMEHTVISVNFEENHTGKPIMPSSFGDDRVSFMISPNPGEPLKPMSRIASGGELSRLMLAVKTIESGRSGLPTMIFDEIDTGISGRMAQAVAEKMISISRHQQVICISHLPQIAAAADHQYLVHKTVRNGRTVTEVDEMDPEQRRDEIARMISGAEGITQDARKYAGQMIDASERKKTAM